MASEAQIRCSERVWRSSIWRSTQCVRKASIKAADGKWYCKQHDPLAAKARQEKSFAKQDAEWAQRRRELRGPTALKALLQIERGHNDPRALAKEILDECRDLIPEDW